MLYDITQPLLECEVYPGDRKPQSTLSRSIQNGDLYNLTELSLCAHNGTHVDAPCHFIKDGKAINEIPLNKFIGPAIVYEHHGNLNKEDAQSILKKANGIKKILIKGKACISLEAAEVFAQSEIDLIGNESQTIGPELSPMAVHLVLLKKEIVLLEGIRLNKVPEGNYILNCAPLNLNNADGSPCRAILYKHD